MEAYLTFRNDKVDEIAAQRDFELQLALRGPGTLTLPGFCVVCGRNTNFLIRHERGFDASHSGQQIFKWHEELTCPWCKLSNRYRASLHMLYRELRPKSKDRIYIAEQVGPVYQMLAHLHPGLVGSEYLGKEFAAGQVIEGVRHEDAHALSFPDRSFDIMLSFDVLEHVADYKLVLAEILRCLKPGGALLFSAPFRDASYDSELRARIDQAGNIEHLLPPQYHGNPTVLEGSLVYQIPGWGLLDDLRDMGFGSPAALHFWSSHYGYLGEPQFLFTARKPAA